MMMITTNSRARRVKERKEMKRECYGLWIRLCYGLGSVCMNLRVGGG